MNETQTISDKHVHGMLKPLSALCNTIQPIEFNWIWKLGDIYVFCFLIWEFKQLVRIITHTDQVNWINTSEAIMQMS